MITINVVSWLWIKKNPLRWLLSLLLLLKDIFFYGIFTFSLTGLLTSSRFYFPNKCFTWRWHSRIMYQASLFKICCGNRLGRLLGIHISIEITMNKVMLKNITIQSNGKFNTYHALLLYSWFKQFFVANWRL